MQITIVLDEDMLESALSPVLSALHRLEDKLDAFVQYEVSTDQEESYNMGIVTDKATAILDEAREQRTVLDSLTVWASGQKDVLQSVRDDLATAIANGATEADLSALDEAIATFDANTDIASAVMENTVADGETPTDQPV